jgi:hypothetical protein
MLFLLPTHFSTAKTQFILTLSSKQNAGDAPHLLLGPAPIVSLEKVIPVALGRDFASGLGWAPPKVSS